MDYDFWIHSHLNSRDKKTKKKKVEEKQCSWSKRVKLPNLTSWIIIKWQMTANAIIHLPRVSMSRLDAWLSYLVCTLQLLIRTVIYFNKAAGISRGGGDNVCREDPAAFQIRAIDLALNSTGQLGSQRRQHKGNRRTQLASWPPALIIIPIRKKASRCSSGYIMALPSRLCPQVWVNWQAPGFFSRCIFWGWFHFSGLFHSHGLFLSI